MFIKTRRKKRHNATNIIRVTDAIVMLLVLVVGTRKIITKVVQVVVKGAIATAISDSIVMIMIMTVW
jgi:hypothetical protein